MTFLPPSLIETLWNNQCKPWFFQCYYDKVSVQNRWSLKIWTTVHQFIKNVLYLTQYFNWLHFFFTGHEVYLKGTSCFKTLVDQFGDRIIGDDGEVDRKVLGSIVFSNPVGIFIWKEEGLIGIQINWFYPATFCVTLQHHKNPTNRVGLVQKKHHHQ